MDERGFGTASVGIDLGATARSGTAVAATAGRVATHIHPAVAVAAAAFTFMGLGFIGYATVSRPVAILSIVVPCGARSRGPARAADLSIPV